MNDSQTLVLHSLDELLQLVELAGTDPLIIAADLVGKNDTSLLRAGQPISTTVVNYLKSNQNYRQEFQIQLTDSTVKACARGLAEKFRHFIEMASFPAASGAFQRIHQSLRSQLSHAFLHPSLVSTLYPMGFLGAEAERILLDHLFAVSVLTSGIATLLDRRFEETEIGANAIFAGLLHDSTLLDYASRKSAGQLSLEEEGHGRMGAQIATGMGLAPSVAQAIKFHHSYATGAEQPQSQSGDLEHVLVAALCTAECYATYRDLIGPDKEDEVLYRISFLGEQGRLDKKAVKALGVLTGSKAIVSDVERLSVIENKCLLHRAAYVYPKIVHSIPTQAVCMKNVKGCPEFESSSKFLSVINRIEQQCLADDMLALPAGEYGKCRLARYLEQSVLTEAGVA